jgi:hypothetical protein
MLLQMEIYIHAYLIPLSLADMQLMNGLSKLLSLVSNLMK